MKGRFVGVSSVSYFICSTTIHHEVGVKGRIVLGLHVYDISALLAPTYFTWSRSFSRCVKIVGHSSWICLEQVQSTMVYVHSSYHHYLFNTSRTCHVAV